MSKKNNQKHLGYQDRKEIEQALDNRERVSAIARELGVPASTVAREIKRNRKCKGYLAAAAKGNRCKHRRNCEVKNLCSIYCSKYCRSCKAKNCKDKCGSFAEQECSILASSPFCCNACHKRRICGYKRYFYYASYAHGKAKERLSESRSGIDTTPEDLERMVRIVKAGLKKGQSFAHIWAAHSEELSCTSRTFYSYVEDGNVDIASIELPKKVRYKLRKKETEKRPKMDFTHRTYGDFLLLDEALRTSRVEMDCVEGTLEDSKVILTLHFVRFSFQLMILLEEKSQASVGKALDLLEECLEGEFSRYIPFIVTDRGTEFLDFEVIEKSPDATKRTSLYYADPMRSNQKGSAENNHRMIRRIIPKGTCFDVLTQWDVATIMSHVNSYLRAHLGGSSPFSLASQVLPKSLFEHMGIVRVPPDEVILHPSLLDIRKSRE